MVARDRRLSGDPMAAISRFAERIQAHEQRIWRGTEGRKVPFTEFRQLVRRYRPGDVLPAMAALACMGKPDEPGIGAMGRYAPDWAIALIARESVLWGNEHRTQGIGGDDFVKLFNSAANIYEGDDHFGDILAMFTRIAYEQFPYQESMFEEVSRTHAMLVEGTRHVPNLEVITESIWEDLLGAPLGLSVGATFFLQVAAWKNQGWFDEGWLTQPNFADILTRWPAEVIRGRALALSSTFDEFKARYAAVPKPPVGLERYAYNPLGAHPFVQMDDGRLLAPQPKLILRTVTPGGLYQLGRDRYGSAFPRDLGKLTEHYVGRHLELAEPDAEVHGEVTYGTPEQKSIDWFLVLPEVVVMFEVKSARFGLLERAGVLGFVDRSQQLINKAIGQLERSVAEMDARNPLFGHIPTDRPRIGVIVTAEPHYLANSGWMRDLLNPSSFPTIVASLRDVEHLMGLPLEEVQEQLVAIANDPEKSTFSLSVALDMSKGMKNPVLENAWDSYPWLDGIAGEDLVDGDGAVEE